MIKLIIFDAGGVLYRGSNEIVDTAVRKFLEKHRVYNFKRSGKVWSKVEKLAFIGKISAREAHERWLEGVGLSKNLADEWAEVDKKEIWGKFGRTPGINRLLRKLKKDYILVVLSDTIDSRHEKIEKMEIVGIDHRVFDEIFTSQDLGTCKPSRKAFWTVLRKFAVKPKEAVFISDSCDELKGAKKIGLITIGFDCDCGDYKIKKLNEISAILKNRSTESTRLSYNETRSIL
ncbi:MAG: HAD family hydrolase [Candidatus Bathyarchaeia archaeon]